MKKHLSFFIGMAVLAVLAFSCEQQRVEPSAIAQPPESSVQPPEQAPEPSPDPAENCKVTIYNASSNPYAYMSVALGTPDMKGLIAGLCPMSKGQSVTLCLPQGELTLYTFSNMYQFSNPIRVTIGPDPITLRLKTGH